MANEIIQLLTVNFFKNQGGKWKFEFNTSESKTSVALMLLLFFSSGCISPVDLPTNFERCSCVFIFGSERGFDS